MTHTPPESKAWNRAGAADRPSGSGEQVGRRDEHGSDLPAAAHDENAQTDPLPPFPEAKRREGDAPDGDRERRGKHPRGG